MKYSIIDNNGNVVYMPSPITYEGEIVYHCGESDKITKMASDLGYYPTEFNAMPKDGKAYKERWEHIDGVNIQRWEEVDQSITPPTVEERVANIENDIALINEALKEGLA